MSEHLIPMVYEFSISALCLFLVALIGKRYTERKTTVIKYLFAFGLTLTSAILIAAVSRILRLTGVWILDVGPPEKKLELLAFTVSFIGFSDIFLTLFILEVFKDGAMVEKNRKYVVIVVILAIVNALFTITTGIYTEDLTDLNWILIICLSAPIYILLIKSSLNLAKRLEEPIPHKSMQLIAVGGFSILLVFVFFMLDAAVGGRYSPYYYVAWVFAVISELLLYTGVIQPDWFKERLTQ